MSFSGTPLGQGRRLDHNTFLGKPALGSERPLPTTSHSFGAPALGSRSPPKQPTSRERPRTDQDDGALLTRPTKWSVNDTSVRLASAIAQAADMSNPNAAWAAGSTSNRAVPRSTSVEYEAANTGRRFAAPPSRRPLGTSSGVTRPLSKTQSATVVPDSEGEESFDNPLKSVSNLASQALKPFSVYARQRSQEPAEAVNNSYDYSNEERDFQNQNRRKTAQKRGGMSADNKAYKPSMSELDESEDEGSDDGQRRRKSKKKEAGRVNTLPTIGETKQRKKRKRGPRIAGQPESEEEEETEPPSLSLENPLQPLRNTSLHPQPRPVEDIMGIDTSHDTSDRKSVV